MGIEFARLRIGRTDLLVEDEVSHFVAFIQPLVA